LTQSSGARPILIFDGTCGFCRRWIERWRAVLGDRVEIVPYQDILDRFPDIPAERFAEAVHFYEPQSDRWSRGAEAVFRSLAYAEGHGWALALYRNLPGFAAVSEWIYRRVAAHRSFLYRVTGWIWGEHLVPPGQRITSWLFLRVLGLIYAVAFLSLAVQISGLVGSHGIYPAQDFFRTVRDHYGSSGFWLTPSIFWMNAGDGMLRGACIAGAVTALALVAGLMPLGCLAILWFLYLSLATVCRDFLWFQWDGLLLEAGFLALFIAPRRPWSRIKSDPPPPRVGLWLLRWLLFRLLVASALVKITSHDPAWRHLTALRYHYETQPLPPWTAWYAHHFPATFQSMSAFLMFMIEGVVPFFLFGPRRIRFAAATAIAGFQLLILLTGNYGFFNWLTLALCLLAFDDGVWPASWRGGLRPGIRPYRSRWLLPAALVLFVLSLVPLSGSAGLHLPLGPVSSLSESLQPFRLVNPYGLFAVMTTERPEIILEGSADGRTWVPYEFRYKPGRLDRRPAFVAPHQPRLDWQLWFAALGDPRSEPWFFSFCQGLLQNSPPVLSLLATNPFPRAPPRYLRATLYDYHFTEAGTRKATGDWWSRTKTRPYLPVLAFEGGQLVAVPDSLLHP
jgi:predicted DCC family thiol-disulfide oxidoreductase YuxK